MEHMHRGVTRTPQTSKVESFARIVNAFWSLTIVAKLSILDVYSSPRYASDTSIFPKIKSKRRRHYWNNIYYNQNGLIVIESCFSCWFENLFKAEVYVEPSRTSTMEKAPS